MSVELAYGKSTLKLDLPEGVNPTVIRKTQLPIVADSTAAIREALDKPIGAPPLRELASGRSSACILICDITRPVPNHLFLQPMIRDMMAAGIPADRITVLVATGLHRPNEGDELAGPCGPWRDAWTRRAGQAGPASRRGRFEDRDRAGGAAFHGRLFRRP
jgi:nickel-dependent lactate racemase